MTGAADAGAPGRLMWWAVGGAGALVVAGGLAFWVASQGGAPAPAEGAVTVRVTASACEPMALDVPAGQTTFVVRNDSDRPLEWEILDGVMVLAERENIAPGLTATLTERLRPGSYAITCGLLSNPHGTLTVHQTAASAAQTSAPPMADFIGPLSEYRVYLLTQSRRLNAALSDLAAALAAGDVPAARAAWQASQGPWARLSPVMGRFSDLSARMEPRAAYLAGREADPGFTGFHRIEYGLWQQGSAEGLQPVAQALIADAAELGTRLGALRLEPADLPRLAALAARRSAEAAPSYAPADPAQAAALREGIARPVTLLRPLVAAADPAAADALDAALQGAPAGAGGAEAAQAIDRAAAAIGLN